MSELETVDLRSDTVTKPNAAMREAMATAEVGDDVLAEDPTVRELEERAATVVAMEASLFVPSGTMGNEIALHLHARPGSEVVCEQASHVFNYEMAGMAALSGLLARPVTAERGVLTSDLVAAAIAPDVSYQAATGVLSLENTANMAGGTVCSPDIQRDAAAVAHRHGIPVHLDGARIFNAAEALGVPVAALTADVDSVMFCLSKGLGAPVGSLLCGSRPFIAEARRVRKMFGGGMRQVGVLAAAGLVALRDGPGSLARDHENARRLARSIGSIGGLRLAAPVETNIVIVEAERGSGWGIEQQTPAQHLVAELAAVRILTIPVARRRVRLVTHRDVCSEALETALARLEGMAHEPHDLRSG